EDIARRMCSLGPITKNLAKLNSEVAQRKENLARLIHNFNLLTTTVGQSDRDLTELVSASNGALGGLHEFVWACNGTLGAVREQDPNVRRAVSLLPSTLSQATTTLNHTAQLASVLGPAVDDLRPLARNLEPTGR